MLKSLFCWLTGGHRWIKVVINNSGWDYEPTFTGEICRYCKSLRNLSEQTGN